MQQPDMVPEMWVSFYEYNKPGSLHALSISGVFINVT